jgi:hypothetical protein
MAEFFNTKAYKVNAVGTFGDSGRNSLLGPKIENLNFAVLRNLYTHESVKTLFRAEAFNLLNHTDLGQPVSNVSSSTFRQINSLNANSTPRVPQLALCAEY